MQEWPCLSSPTNSKPYSIFPSLSASPCSHSTAISPHGHNPKQFLIRMKRAKDQILNHHRSNKNKQMDDNMATMIRSKTEEIAAGVYAVDKDQEYFVRDLKKFPEICYKMGGLADIGVTLDKKQSQGNEKYNDKLIKQSKSQIIPEANRKRHNIYKIKSVKYVEQAQLKIPRIKSFLPLTPTNLRERGKYRNPADMFLQKLELKQDLINDNASSLVEKLIKCRTTKQNAQNQSIKEQSVREKETKKQEQDLGQTSIPQQQAQNQQIKHSTEKLMTKSLPKKIKLELNYKKKLNIDPNSRSTRSTDKTAKIKIKSQKQATGEQPCLQKLIQAEKQVQIACIQKAVLEIEIKQQKKSITQMKKRKQSIRYAIKPSPKNKDNNTERKKLDSNNFRIQGWNAKQSQDIETYHLDQEEFVSTDLY